MSVVCFLFFFFSVDMAREKKKSDSKIKCILSVIVFLSVWGSIRGFPDPVFFLFLSAERTGERKQTEKKTNSSFFLTTIFSFFRFFFVYLSGGCVWGFSGSSFFQFFSGFLSLFPSFSAERAREGEKKTLFFVDRNKFFCFSCLAGSGGGGVPDSVFSFFCFLLFSSVFFCFLLFSFVFVLFLCLFYFFSIFLLRGPGRKKKKYIYIYIYIYICIHIYIYIYLGEPLFLTNKILFSLWIWFFSGSSFFFSVFSIFCLLFSAEGAGEKKLKTNLTEMFVFFLFFLSGERILEMLWRPRMP